MKKSAVIFAGAVLAASALFADTITLKNGDSFIGRIIRYADDTYFLESDQEGEKSIPAREVKSIEFSSGSQRKAAWAPRKEEGSYQEEKSDRPLKAPAECEWAKTALVTKPLTKKLDEITSARISMAGKLVKFVFQARSDIKQVGDNLYTACIDDGWEVHSRVSFTKDGLDYMERAPDRRRKWEQSVTGKYACYGIILSEDMKKEISKQPWEIGDIFLVGKTMKKSMGTEANISW